MYAKNCTRKPKTWPTSYKVSTRSSCRETLFGVPGYSQCCTNPLHAVQQQHRGLQTLTPPYTELKNLLDNLHKPVCHEHLNGCCRPCFVYLAVYRRCTNSVHAEQQVLHQPCACSNNTDANRQLHLHAMIPQTCEASSTCTLCLLGWVLQALQCVPGYTDTLYKPCACKLATRTQMPVDSCT